MYTWCDDAVGSFWLHASPDASLVWILENIRAKNKGIVMGLQKSPYPLLCHFKTPPSFLGGPSGGPVPMRLLAMVVLAYHGGPRPLSHTLL